MADQQDDETEEFTITGPDGTSETVALPAGLAAAFAEEGEDGVAVAGDFLVQAFAQQTHAVVHHAEGEPPAELVDLDGQMAAIFEERFGVPLEQAMHG